MPDCKFKKFFNEKNYEKAYQSYLKSYTTHPEKHEKYEIWLEEVNEIYNNLGKYTEKELLHKTNVAANMRYDFLALSLGMLTLIKNPDSIESIYLMTKYSLDIKDIDNALYFSDRMFEFHLPENPYKYYILMAEILLEKCPDYHKKTELFEKTKQEIFKYINKAIEYEPNNILNYIMLRDYYYLDYPNINPEKLIEIYNKMISIDPDTGYLYSYRARVKEEIEDIKGAIADYKKAIKLGDVDSFEELGMLYFNNKMYDEFFEPFEKAIKELPTIDIFWLKYIIEKNTNENNYPKFEKLLNGYLIKYPKDLRIYQMLAYVKCQMKKFQQAIKYTNYILKHCKDNDEIKIDALFRKGFYYDLLKKDKLAIKYYDEFFKTFEKEIKELSSIEIYWLKNIIEKNKNENNYPKFEKLLNSYLIKHPKNLRIYQMITFVKCQMKEFQQAIKYTNYILKHCHCKDDDDIKFYALTLARKAYCYDILKKYKLAIRYYDKVIELCPDNPLAYLNKSRLLFLMHKIEEGLTLAQKAVKIAPEDPTAFINLAWIEMNIGKLKKALKHLDKATELDKNNPDGYKLKTSLYYTLKDYEKALQNAAPAIKNALKEDLPDLYYLRSLIYKNLGDEEKSKGDYEKTFELKPDFDIKKANMELKLTKKQKY